MKKLENSKTSGSKKNRYIDEILQELISKSKRALRQFAKDYSVLYTQQLNEFIKLFNEESNKNANGFLTESDFFKVYADFINAIQECTKQNRFIESELTFEYFLTEYTKEIDDFINDLPVTKKLTISDSFYLISSEEPFTVNGLKYLLKLRYSFEQAVYAATLRFYKLLKKEKQPVKRKQRTIKVRNFIKVYYYTGFVELLQEAWWHCLKVASENTVRLHQQLNQAHQSILEIERLLQPVQLKLELTDKEYTTQLNSLKSFEIREFDNSLVEEKFEIFKTEVTTRVYRDWQYAGTLILPHSRYNENRFSGVWQKLEKRFNDGKIAWQKYLDCEHDDWEKDLHLDHLQLQAVQFYSETVNSVSGKILEKIIPGFEEMSAEISRSMHKFQKIGLDEIAKLETVILSENRLMLRNMRKQKLPELMELLINAQFTKSLDNYLSRIKYVVDNLPQDHIVFRQLKFHDGVPHINVDDIRLKELVQEEILPVLEKQHAPLSSEVAQKAKKIHRSISEIDHIIEYNLESAMDLLQESGDEKFAEAQKVVIEGLERTNAQLASLIEQNTEITAQVNQILFENTREFATRVQELCDNDKILAIKFRLAKAKTREEVKDYWYNSVAYTKNVYPKTIDWFKIVFEKIKQSYLKVRKITGLPVPVQVEQQLLQMVTGTKNKINSLPYVYQRLFKFEPLEDERFFSGRDSEYAKLEEQLQAWRNGEYGITALIGEKGSGKTSLLNSVRTNIYQNFPQTTIELKGITFYTEEVLVNHLQLFFPEQAFTTLDELEQEIGSFTLKRIIIVEDIQNMFLRTVTGFNLLERFLLLISRTHETVYWLLTCTLYSWHFIDKVINISKYCHGNIFLTQVPRNEIENIVLKRHRVSGYELEFEASDKLRETKKFKKLKTPEAQQEYLQGLYFDQLHRIAAGNITVTMMFWLSSVEKILQDRMVLNPEIQFEYSFLYNLSMDEMFTLAALVQHECLQADEHALVFNQAPNQSQMLLNRMKNRGILVKTSSGYQVHHFLYRPIIQALKLKNILH